MESAWNLSIHKSINQPANKEYILLCHSSGDDMDENSEAQFYLTTCPN